jgi:hypothetical protein
MLDRDRSRERDSDRRVEHVQDYDDQARESMLARDGDRRVEHMQDYDDQVRESMLDDDWNRDDDRVEYEQGNSRMHGGDVDKDHTLDVDTDKNMDRISDPIPDKSFDEHKKEQSRRNIE